MAAVIRTREGHRLAEDERLGGLGNRFLAHLSTRQFSAATVRAYAYDLANFTRFLADRGLDLGAVVPSDLFDYLDWQQGSARLTTATVVPLRAGRRPAAATMNRRVAAVRGLCEFAVAVRARQDNPVPAARRASGLRSLSAGAVGASDAAR